MKNNIISTLIVIALIILMFKLIVPTQVVSAPAPQVPEQSADQKEQTEAADDEDDPDGELPY